MNTSESINELAAALAMAQGKMETAKMNAVNPFLKNKYADLGAIIDAIKPQLAANGLSFIQMPTAPSELFPGVGLVTRLLHSSGQWVEESFYMPIPEGKGINSAQQYGVALTYARRYALASLFGIVADSDTDGATDKPASSKPAQTAVTTPAPKAPPKPSAVPVAVDGDTPPASLADFAVWFAARHAYYKDNYHVVGALKKIYGGSIGTQFLSYDKAEVMAKLETYASDEANGAD